MEILGFNGNILGLRENSSKFRHRLHRRRIPEWVDLEKEAFASLDSLITKKGKRAVI